MCGDGWDDSNLNANVVCRQLGFATAGIYNNYERESILLPIL